MQAERAYERSNTQIPFGKSSKLVVWSLDEALEAQMCREADNFRNLIAALDERGILQSGVSETRGAWERSGLEDFLLCPQLRAGATARAVAQIAATLNINLAATLLVAANANDREEVARTHPEVRAIAPDALPGLMAEPFMGKTLASVESRPRRLVYREELARMQSEQLFQGSRDCFLAGLELQLTVAPAAPPDLHRVRELVTRPNQLCATYTDEELERLTRSRDHACLLVSLRDRFGDCGQVGLVLLEISSACWTLQLFLFSCRVTRRGIDKLLLRWLMQQARAAGVRLLAQFRASSKNESLLQAYREAGFELIDTRAEPMLLERGLATIPEFALAWHLRFERPSQMLAQIGG